MKENPFPYSYWTKILGLVFIAAGIFSFFFQYLKRGTFDLNELAVGISWGLVFIFFSKEKTDDEMMRGLKFKALTRSIIISFFITHLYNYLFLNWRIRKNQEILSISAYQFLTLTLIIATVMFYYFKLQATINEEE